jgi:anion-transporting  ArsA/GET3 family ATPase
MTFKDELKYLLNTSPDEIIRDAIHGDPSLFGLDKSKHLEILQRIVGALYEERIQRIKTAKETQFRGGAIPESEAKMYSEAIEPLKKRQAELVNMIEKNKQTYSIMITEQLELARKTKVGNVHS